MGLSVVFLSGLRRSGKSAVIRAMTTHLWKQPPHYIRLVKCGSDKRPPKSAPAAKPEECGVASARWLQYDDERVFEVLPETLAAIHKKDRFGSVVIEADADAALRHAYPYDHRVFVMPLPGSIGEVFRDPRTAASELQRVLDDTAAFASEIFGLWSSPTEERVEPSEERPELTASHARSFLYSPLGDELATRIQLQTPYHGLVESDVVIVNNKVGEAGVETSECLRRVEQLMERARAPGERQAELHLCNPCDENGRSCKKLFKALTPMCVGGK